ncbi:tetratricopeptide repeat protein [Marinicrinis lubricantis]|uniref:Tetratricopeptide repeat protein n=1 Tax=Marinicrinis lubricantis TaxID=2086470 RepID=A0ABW1ILY3_9BACL
MDGKDLIKKAYEAIFQSDFEQAIYWFEEAIKKEPVAADYHYKLSITCARSDKLQKAIIHAETACLLNKEHEEYRYHLHTLQSRNWIEKAENALRDHGTDPSVPITMLKEALKLDPLSAKAYVLLGIAYAAQGHNEQAAECIREALKLDPQNENALKWMEELQRELPET